MSTLTRDIAQAQVARLLANPMLVPQTKQGMTELVDCLMRHCQSAEHCAAAMTALLDGSLEFPRDLEATTARLSYAARELQEPESVPAGCDICCLGEDCYTGEVCWSPHVAFERNGYTYAVRCTCERGRWLARKDAERREANE